jgi:hypothetical protein
MFPHGSSNKITPTGFDGHQPTTFLAAAAPACVSSIGLEADDA